MFSPVEEIKNRLDIVDVIGAYIKLQKAGINYRAVCPFHTEKKPSFFVSPTRQLWHCFGSCSTGGDIFKFVMKIEGVEFGDALRLLAQKAGIELKKNVHETEAFKSERQRLYEICELATKFFEKQLSESSSGKQAREYLLGRGLSEESLVKWRVGYAPDVWQGLADFLNTRGYQKSEIEKAGLGLTSEKGSFYDRFRGRIIFPIFDLNSQVVGFGGRVFKDKDKAEIAKYVNTPQTILYDKSRLLYGLDKAKIEIRKKNCCILVEGYMDLIMVSQAGFENIVATSGTALTPFQLKILKRYTDNLMTSFDMDLAGDAATKRGIDLAQHQGFNLKVITLPQGLDPADAVLKDTALWEKGVNEAKSIMDFYLESSLAKFDKNTPEGKQEIARIVLPAIKRIPSMIVRSHWVAELAKHLKVKETDIEAELSKVKDIGVEADEESANREPVVKKSRKELLEERLLTLILKSPENKEVIEEGSLSEFSPQIKDILVNLKSDAAVAEMPPQLAEFFNCLALKADIEEIEEKDIEPEIRQCLKEMRMIELRKKLDNISKELKIAEESQNGDLVSKLIEDFKSYSNSLHEFESN